MRKALLFGLLFMFCGVYAVAQDYHKGEIFAGYSFLHFDCGSGCPDSNAAEGFNLDGTYYFNHLVGFTGDFQYHKKDISAIAIAGTDARTLSGHFGPRLKFRAGRVEPFVHGLFGFTNLDVCAPGVACISDTVFSMKIGGGLDVSVARHFAVRLGEFNYYYTNFSKGSLVNFNGNDHQSNFTFSTGIVIR